MWCDYQLGSGIASSFVLYKLTDPEKTTYEKIWEHEITSSVSVKDKGKKNVNILAFNAFTSTNCIFIANRR